jgi:uridine phosphorylase
MVEHLRRRGVLGIDMETSAILSVAIHQRVRAGCILVASTNLIDSRESLGFYSENLDKSIIQAVKICIEALKRLVRCR